MNYFEDAPEWNPIDLDPDLLKDITKYHPYLASKSYCPEGMDGFFFVDRQDWAILIDMNTKEVRCCRNDAHNVFHYNEKYNFFIDGDERIYFKNQLMIKDGKKFYFIVSQKKSFFLDVLFKIQFVKNRIYSSY